MIDYSRELVWSVGVVRAIWLQLVVRRCLAGSRLPCGCLVGVYETINGETIRLIDARGPSCEAGAAHAPHAVLAGVSVDGF